MKKKNFVSLVFGTVGGILFALGMCMCLLPEWGAFTPRRGDCGGGRGGPAGFAAGPPEDGGQARCPHQRQGGGLGIVGALVLGVGMCMAMVWSMLVPGIVMGVAGILLLLCLIPLVPQKTFTRSQLMEEFWDGDTTSGPRTVDVYITKLRSKFAACKDFEIVTVHGLGYKAVLK